MTEKRVTRLLANGQAYTRLVLRKSGQTVLDKGTEKIEGLVEIDLEPDQLVEVRASFGITVNMEDMESARVAVTLSVACLPESIDAVQAAADSWVFDKILDEMDGLKGVKHERPQLIPFAPDMGAAYMVVGLDYGRTLNMGNYAFRKPDSGLTLPTTVDGLEATFEDLSARVGQRIAKLAKRAKRTLKIKPAEDVF